MSYSPVKLCRPLRPNQVWWWRHMRRTRWQIAPEDGAAFVGELPRKGAINSDKSILNELFYLRVAKHARGFTFTGRHENPHIAWPIAITRSKQSVTTREPRGGNPHRRPPPAGAGNAVSG
jgi:hypothetical protein